MRHNPEGIERRVVDSVSDDGARAALILVTKSMLMRRRNHGESCTFGAVANRSPSFRNSVTELRHLSNLKTPTISTRLLWLKLPT